jgi:gluconolactonase
MMIRSLLSLALCLSGSVLGAQVPAGAFDRPASAVGSIPAPESVAIGPDGAWYVSSFGKFGVAGDGAVYRVEPGGGRAKVWATGLDDPCGLVFVGDTLWAADRRGVYRVRQGRAELVYDAASFPRPLHFLNDLATGPAGTLYVSDTGDSTAAGRGAVFVLAPGKRPVVLPGSDTVRAQSSANGLYRDPAGSLYVVGYRSGVMSVTDGRGTWREVAHGLGSPDGIEAAGAESFYVTDNVGGDLWLVPRQPGGKIVKLASGLRAPADLVLDRRRGLLIVPENDAGRLAVYRVAGDGGALPRESP